MPSLNAIVGGLLVISAVFASPDGYRDCLSFGVPGHLSGFACTYLGVYVQQESSISPHPGVAQLM